LFDIYMEQYKDEMIRDLVRFIKIESVKDEPLPNKPYGKGIFDALMFIHDIAGKMDFECVNLFGHLAYIDYGSGDETLAILTHIDIVPAGEGWTKPPFGGEIENGRIYGRGTMDNKGPAIAALYALKAISDNMIELNKKVRIIFGCDEESRWSDIDFYNKHEPQPDMAFSPDGNYPIINAEKGLAHIEFYANPAQIEGAGIQILKFESGERPNIVPNKAFCVLKADAGQIKAALSGYKDPRGAEFEIQETAEGVQITAKGKSAHGSRPQEGINAAAALFVFVNTLPLAEGGVNELVKFTVQKIGHTFSGENLGLELSDEISGPLTFNIGAVHYNREKFTLVIDIRYPVSFKQDFILGKINENFASTFEIAVVHALPPHHLPENSELIVKLKEAYEEITGEKAYTMSEGGATYARAFKNAVTFGPKFPGKPSLEHGPDEYIEIDDFVLDAKIIANALVKLCTEES